MVQSVNQALCALDCTKYSNLFFLMVDSLGGQLWESQNKVCQDVLGELKITLYKTEFRTRTGKYFHNTYICCFTATDNYCGGVVKG